MKEMIKKYVASVVCALATLLITGSAWAAVNPTAVFSNFTGADTETGITVGGYTLKANGNTVDAHGITISTTSGVTLEPTSGNGNVTVIVRYSGFPSAAVASNTALISASIDSGKSSNCGMAIKGNDSNKAYTYIGTGFRTTTSIGGAANPSVPTAGRIALSYRYDGGTAIYVGPNDGTLEGGLDSTFKWGGSTLGRISIGASLASTWPATGMKIEEIAVIAGTSYLDAAGMNELAAYKFPSETAKEAVVAEWTDFNNPTSGDFTWTIGNTCTVNADGSVTIGASNGLTLTVPSSCSEMYENRKLTVILDADIPNFGAEKTLIDATVSGANKVSINYDGSTMRQRWNGSGDGYGNAAIATGRHLIASTYQGAKGVGTTTYVDGVQKMDATGLQGSSGNITKIGIGNYNTNGGNIATGMRVYRVAIFAKKLSAEEVAAYKFPTSSVLAVNFSDSDAATVISATSGDIDVLGMTIPGSAWFDSNKTATQTNPQTVTAYDLNGKEVLGDTAKVIWTSKNTWKYTDVSSMPLKGYLDDGNHDNKGAEVHFTNIPFSLYDAIIIYATDKGTCFNAPTVNDESYTYKNGEVCKGSDTWGTPKTGTIVEGVNALRIKDLTGPTLDILATPGDPMGSANRACIAAVVIVERTDVGPTVATVTLENDAEIFWSQIVWDDVAPSAAIPAEITVNNGAYIYMDGEVTAKNITFKGTGAVTIIDNYGTSPTYNVGKITSELPITVVSATMLTVDSGNNDLTYNYVGAAAATTVPPITCGGNLTLGGSSEIKWTAAVAANKTLTIADTCKVNYYGNGQSIQGTININKNATLVNKNDNDTLGYGSSAHVNVWGTLDMSNTRWTIGNNNVITLYPGAKSIGEGHATYKAFDFNTANNVLKFALGDAASGTATLTTGLRMRNGTGPTLNIPENMTVEFGSIFSTEYDNRTVTKSGAGALKILDALRMGNNTCTLNVSEGMLDLSAITGGSLATQIPGNVTIGSGVSVRFPAGFTTESTFTLCNGTLSVANQRERHVAVYIGDSDTPVANAIVVYDTIAKTVTYEIESSRDIDLKDLDTVTLDDIINKVDDDTWTGDVKVAVKNGATVEIGDDTIPYSGIIVTCDGAVSINYTAETADNFAKYDFTNVAGDLTIETGIELDIDAGERALVYTYTGDEVIAPTLVASAITINTGAQVDVNAGAAPLTYNYNGEEEITPALVGSGAFTKGGIGTICVNFGASRTAETIVNAGVLKTTAQKALGTNYTVTINANGVLDFNGYSNNGQPTIVLNGGTLRNTRDDQPTSQMQILNLSLTASSTIDAQEDFGLVGSGHGKTTLNLGEYILTKSGDGQFHIVNTEVSGSGTIKVAAGSLHVSNSACTMENGTIELDGGNLGLDAAFTLNYLTIKNGEITGNGALTLTGAMEIAGNTIATAKLASVASPLEIANGAVYDLTGVTLPIANIIGATQNGSIKIEEPAKAAKIAPVADGVTQVPAGLSVVDADGNAITTVCVYDGFLWYGNVGSGTYTVTNGDIAAMNEMDAGDIYSPNSLEVNIATISGTPTGFFGWVENATAYFAKKSNSISLKTGARTIKDNDNQPWATSILSTDASVGGFPVAGKFWNNTKISNGNQAEVKDYMLLTDGNGNLTEVAVAYRAHNTYYAKYSGAMESGNMRLTGSYLDDNQESKDTQYTISESSQPGVTIPGGSVTLPKAPNARGWQFEVSNIPYEMYDLYVYIASDVQDNVDNANSHLYACPVVISCDGENWTYYAGPSKATDNDSWEAYGWAHANNVVEGKNYIRFRISKNSTGLDDISTIHITHGTRNTGTNKRLGLAGIQIVEIDDDGVRDRVVSAEEIQSWHDEKAWSKKKGDGTELVDWTDSDETNPITARIDASEIPAITMDDDAVVDKLVISGETETFTIEGDGELTATAIDATDFTGNIVFDAPVTGALSLGENAKLVVEIDDGEEVSVDNLLPAGLTIASGSITIIGSGTLVCDGKVPDAYATSLQNSTWTGTVWIKNILIPDVKNLVDFGQYKNASSKICLTGVRGWLNNGNQNVALELANETVEETTVLGLEIQDSSGGYKYLFPKFTGTGSFKAATISTDSAAYIVTDVSEFNGALLSTAGTLRKEGHAKDREATNPRPIFVGYSDVNEVTAGTDSLIDIKSGTTVNADCGWEAASVVFGDTLTVKGEIGDVLVSGVTTAPTALPALVDVTGQSSMTLKYENNAIVLAQAAASFNGKGYATLAEAITAANASDEGGTVTVYAAWPEADALTVDVDEDKTITLVGGGDGSYICGTVVTKTGAGTLVLDGPINSNVFAPIVSGGKMTVTDRVMKESLGESYFYCNSVVVAPNSTFELSNNTDATIWAMFSGTEDGCGTVVKSGSGNITLGIDSFGAFNGVIELDNGGVCGFGANITIKSVLKISGAAYLDVTSDSNSYVIFDNGSKLDLSNISEERTDAIVKGNLTMAEGTAIVFAEDQEALLCNGALTIGEDAITETTTVTGMSIFVDGQEYIADLGIAVAEGESGAKLYTVSYDNAAPIIRITADGMDASDLNAALVAAGEGAKVYFDDEATLMLDENVEDVDLVILGTANIDGEGTISAATIAAAGKTIDLGEDVTFIPATPSELSTTTITGEGTIVYDGALPGNEKSSYQDTANWTGTVWLKNYNYQRFDFGALGHSGSKVKLTHIWGFSPNDATSGANPEIVLVDEGSNVALEINDGHADSKYFFRKLSGDGTFKTSGSQGTNSQYRFYDVSDFEGTFALNGNNKRVVIGTGSTDAGNGQILIDNTATVAIPAGKTWSANKGIKVDGTIAGAGILGSDTTFGNGATIDASAAQLTVEANKTLTFGSSLTVKLASAPEEDSPVKIMNGSFTEQTFDTTLTVVVNDQQAEGDFAIKQDADGVWAIANTEVVWTGNGTDRNWSNPANWQGGVVPTAGRNVVIDVGEATDYSIVIDTDTAAINSLTVTGAGVVFSGEGTINGPITFTTPKIAGSLKAVGDVTVSAAGAVEVTGGMDITGNLTFDNHFETLTFKDNAEVNVTGDMRTTEQSNAKVYFYDGEITVSGTLYTGADNNAYTRYYFGDADSSAMVITVNKLDANFYGRAFLNYDLKSDATINVDEGGFIMQGRGDYQPLFNFAGGKYVATATSTFGGANNLQYVVSADSTIEVAGGATLTINNTVNSFGQAEKKITKNGAGTLKFAGKVLTDIDVTAGAVEMTAGDEAGVTVSGGAKLYLKVTAEQKEAGYTSTATIPAGMNIYFILPDGTVVEGVGGILPPKTIAWIGADQGSWDEPSNWSPAVVPLEGSIVSFAGEGEGTITIKISDGTRTIEGVSFNSSKNITIDGVVNVTGAITKDGTGTLAINLGADNSNAIAVTAGALEVNVPANTTRVLSGAITGSGTIVKSGEGALHINRANNTGFTGSWDVKGGDLKGLAEKWYGADNNNTPIVLTVNDGATLHLANMGDSAYSLVCNGGTVNNDGNVTGSRYTMGCRQAKNITINGDTIFTGNQFGLLASSYGATTLTFNNNATLTINMNANSAFFMTSTTVSGTGTINVTQGIFSSANNNGTAPVVNEGVKVVVDGGTVKADKNTLTIHTLEYVSGSFASNANAAIKVTGTLSGSSTIPRLTLGDGATIPVTSEITVSSALALDDTINIDLGTTGSGNFHVITAPNGYEWDTSKVTLSGSDLTDWNVSAEGTTLVVSKLPLDAIVDEDDGYNFDEKVIKVDVTKIDSTLKGTQIKVVTTDKNGDDVSTTLVQIDGSKGMYDVVIGELTAGETYNFKVTFVDSKGVQIDQSKEANLKNIAVGTLIEGEDIFSADATSGDSVVDGGDWDEEHTPTIPEGENYYQIVDDVESIFNVEKTAPDGSNFTVEYDLSFEPGFATELMAEATAPIAGLTIGEGDTDETTNWYRADSTAETGWSKLDQDVTPGHYIIRMAFTATTVTYSVKGDEDTDFVTLTQNETTSAFEISSSAISSVSFQGSSSLAKFGAKTDDTIDTAIANDGEKDLTTIEGVLASLAAGKTVTLKTNVAIDTSSLTAGESYNITADGFNLRWDDERIVSYDDKTGAFTITAEKPENGFTSFENYALNLNSGDPSSKPIGVAPADNGKLNTLTVEIKGPDGNELEVRDGYAIKCIATPNVVGGKEVISTNLKQIDLPLPESGEVQYTIKIEVIKE